MGENYITLLWYVNVVPLYRFLCCHVVSQTKCKLTICANDEVFDFLMVARSCSRWNIKHHLTGLISLVNVGFTQHTMTLLFMLFDVFIYAWSDNLFEHSQSVRSRKLILSHCFSSEVILFNLIYLSTVYLLWSSLRPWNRKMFFERVRKRRWKIIK